MKVIIVPNLSHPNTEVRKTNISLIAASTRTIPHKIGPVLKDLIPSIIGSASSPDPELTEAALQCLETFVYRCPSEMSPFLPSVIGVSAQAIKYDPVRRFP